MSEPDEHTPSKVCRSRARKTARSKLRQPVRVGTWAMGSDLSATGCVLFALSGLVLLAQAGGEKSESIDAYDGAQRVAESLRTKLESAEQAMTLLRWQLKQCTRRVKQHCHCSRARELRHASARRSPAGVPDHHRVRQSVMRPRRLLGMEDSKRWARVKRSHDHGARACAW